MYTFMITSIDVGIRNLAYCTLEYQPTAIDGDQYRIHQWGVIDLLEDDVTNGSKKKQSKKLTCQNGSACQRPVYYYYQSKPLWRIRDSREFQNSQLRRYYTVLNTSRFELARLVISALDKIDFSRSLEVVIESQPSTDPRMKNLSMMILNYFIIRYVVEKPLDQQHLQDIPIHQCQK